MDMAGLQEAVFSVDEQHFNSLALEIFRHQSQNCRVYREYLGHLQIDMTKIHNVDDIPFLPIEFFKNFEVRTGNAEPQIVFESSSTTGMGVSRHFVPDTGLYRRSFVRSFEHFFGPFADYCHLALLPSYLEREHSSLVFQVDHFISHSKYEQSAFFLYDKQQLYDVLLANEERGIPTILWGVTYALLDFCDTYTLDLKHTILIETGGMKGRRKEITREELHGSLKKSLGVQHVAGEYGMTELMSQAYAVSNGLYKCPPWMRVSGREINDPLGKPIYNRHAAVNVIDLANLHSCAFIATSDIGRVETGSNIFSILGRLDYSDTRGCNLLVG